MPPHTSNPMEILLDYTGDELTKEQRDKVCEIFKLLDNNRDGKLTVKEVGMMFRAIGQNPTDEDLADMLKAVPPVGLDVEGFISFFTTNYKPPTTEDQLVKAFQVFDNQDTGIMSADKFKSMLSSLGEPMPESEVDSILREVEVDEKGLFNYKQLARRLCEGPRRIPDMSREGKEKS